MRCRQQLCRAASAIARQQEAGRTACHGKSTPPSPGGPLFSQPLFPSRSSPTPHLLRNSYPTLNLRQIPPAAPPIGPGSRPPGSDPGQPRQIKAPPGIIMSRTPRVGSPPRRVEPRINLVGSLTHPVESRICSVGPRIYGVCTPICPVASRTYSVGPRICRVGSRIWHLEGQTLSFTGSFEVNRPCLTPKQHVQDEFHNWIGSAPAPGAVSRALAENLGRAGLSRRRSIRFRVQGRPRGRILRRPRAGVLPSGGFRVQSTFCRLQAANRPCGTWVAKFSSHFERKDAKT
jgi:hypothetical protein